MSSRNVYRFPFSGYIKPARAPFHDETKWQMFALDFPMAEGTRVLAAYDGIVLDVNDGSTIGGPYKKLLNKCNVVQLAHENDEFTEYVHLRKGIEVRKGQRVSAGDLIGYSGMTGYTTYPHLHFAVCIEGARYLQTIRPRFRKGRAIISLQSPP